MILHNDRPAATPTDTQVMSNPAPIAPAVTVSNPDRLAELVRDCGAAGRPIVDYGVAHTGLGHPPPLQHVRLTQHGSVIEHYVRDMVVRAAAGITLRQLQAELQPHGQFLPIDADDDLTLGEVIAHNVYGGLRLGFGAMRDRLLGLGYVDGLGRKVHVGGRTVKNVAGYDVTRLMIGSLGELGILYEATVRTAATPQAAATAEIELIDPQALDATMTAWLTGGAAPASVEMTARRGRWVVHAGYFGGQRACDAQLAALQPFVSHLPHARIKDIRRGTYEANAEERALRRSWRRQAPALVKIVVPPGVTGALCQTIASWAQRVGPLELSALPAHGCVFAGGPLDHAAALELDRELQRVLESLGGLCVWYRRPPISIDNEPTGRPPHAEPQQIEPFWPPQPDESMLTRLKAAMDPLDIFNRGRSIPLSDTRSQP